MYYRRKAVLALLQEFGGELPSGRFRKLLFVFTRNQNNPAYQFVPARQGPYSFQVMSDKGTMTKYELLEDSEDWKVRTTEDYTEELKGRDKKLLVELQDRFGQSGDEELLQFIYKEYPFYAIRTDIQDTHLSDAEKQRIEQCRPVTNGQKLYTIGYEGIKAETYMNRLLEKSINLLVDVRKNSMSRKFGFSKSQLQHMCNTLDIKFLHMPELGIEAEKRKDLETQEEYDELFEEYEQKMLPNRIERLEELYRLYEEYKRLALTCYEKNPEHCHRNKITGFLRQNFELPVEHL